MRANRPSLASPETLIVASVPRNQSRSPSPGPDQLGVAEIRAVGQRVEVGRAGRLELGFPGVVITSETNDLYLDAPEFEPFWAECARLGLFVFVHPALKLKQTKQFDGYDTARSVGREFSLVMATIRLINSGVFDRHPDLTIHMSHLGGGLSALLGRIRSYQDKEFWGTLGNARHGLPRTISDLGLTDEQFGQAVLHAPSTRPDRFTVLEHLALDEEGVRGRVGAFAEAFGR